MHLEGTFRYTVVIKLNVHPRIPADSRATAEGIPRRLGVVLWFSALDHWVIFPLNVAISVG